MMKTEKAIYTQAGYKCSVCEAHCKVFNGANPPEACPNCGVIGMLTMDWNQKIESTMVITPLPITFSSPVTPEDPPRPNGVA